MILAVDPGFANLGWAVVRPRTARVLDCGLMHSEPDRAIDKSTDRARRMSRKLRELRYVVRRYECNTIAAESMLGHGAAAAVAANILPWGGLLGLAVCLDLDVVEVTAKRWQRAVMGVPKGQKYTYEQLAKRLELYAANQLGDRLQLVSEDDRTHVLDAIGVGLYAALTRANARRVYTAEVTA